MIDFTCEPKIPIKLSNAVFSASEVRFATLSAHNKHDLRSTNVTKQALESPHPDKTVSTSQCPKA